MFVWNFSSEMLHVRSNTDLAQMFWRPVSDFKKMIRGAKFLAILCLESMQEINIFNRISVRPFTIHPTSSQNSDLNSLAKFGRIANPLTDIQLNLFFKGTLNKMF